MKKEGKLKKRKFSINIHLTNRWLYTLIALGILAIIGIGVWASLTPGVKPNPGHWINETAPPAGCGSGQFLEFKDGNWVCATPSGSDSDWVISGNNMYSGVSGNVGIGTTSPGAKLDVNGEIASKSVSVGELKELPNLPSDTNSGPYQWNDGSCNANTRGKIAIIKYNNAGQWQEDFICFCLGAYQSSGNIYWWACLT